MNESLQMHEFNVPLITV